MNNASMDDVMAALHAAIRGQAANPPQPGQPTQPDDLLDEAIKHASRKHPGSDRAEAVQRDKQITVTLLRQNVVRQHVIFEIDTTV